MKRALAATLLAAAALATPAAAAPPTPGGFCTGSVDLVCRTDAGCEDFCNPQFCLVWLNGRCGLV